MTKTISIMSDLHLEFAVLADLPGGDILILAGDIWLARDMAPNKQDADSRKRRKRYEKFCAEELAKYGRVLAITGNHESYGSNIDFMDDTIREFLAKRAPHARLLSNETEVIDGVAFLGTPLWATCGAGSPMLEWTIGRGMNDFRLIWTSKLPPADWKMVMRNGERHFLPRDANLLHEQAVAWLRAELPKHDAAIVIGHHAPSMLSAGGEHYGTEDLDLAYCSNQHELIELNTNINIFIHGHTHRAERYQIGSTKIVANPRGYFPAEPISRQFDPAAADITMADILAARPIELAAAK